MKKKQKNSQGNIINEIRKAREIVNLRFTKDPKKFVQQAEERMKTLGITYATNESKK